MSRASIQWPVISTRELLAATDPKRYDDSFGAERSRRDQSKGVVLQSDPKALLVERAALRWLQRFIASPATRPVSRFPFFSRFWRDDTCQDC